MASKSTKREKEINKLKKGVDKATAVKKVSPVKLAVNGNGGLEVAPVSDFVIEDGIEIPARQRGGSGFSRYPFAALNEGSSFFVPSDVDASLYANDAEGNKAVSEDLKTIANRLSGATRRFRRTYPEFKFAIRQSLAPAGVRVWRVEA